MEEDSWNGCPRLPNTDGDSQSWRDLGGLHFRISQKLRYSQTLHHQADQIDLSVEERPSWGWANQICSAAQSAVRTWEHPHRGGGKDVQWFRPGQPTPWKRSASTDWKRPDGASWVAAVRRRHDWKLHQRLQVDRRWTVRESGREGVRKVTN